MAISQDYSTRKPFDADELQLWFIKLEIDAFEEGVQDMPKELLGWYFAILLKMYRSKGGKLPYDLPILAKRFGTTARVMRRVTDTLMEQGKLYLADGCLRNPRCDQEREKVITEYVNRHKAAVKRHAGKESSPEVSAKFQQSLPEVSAELPQNFAETVPNNPTKSTNDLQSGADNLLINKSTSLEVRKDTPLPPEGDARSERKQLNREVAREAFEIWQRFAERIGLPVPRDSSFETFGRKIAERMHQHAAKPKGRDELIFVWNLATVQIERSQFLRGMTSHKFKADLKWLCQRESFDKLISGGYGNGAAHVPDPLPGPANLQMRLAECVKTPAQMAPEERKAYYAKLEAEEEARLRGVPTKG